MSTLPLQHQEIRELSKLLCSGEALLASEREASGRKTLESEREAREQEEKSRCLLEQLCLLQQELDNGRRDRTDLEEQMKVYAEESQQVGPLASRWLPPLTTRLPATPISNQSCLISAELEMLPSPGHHRHGSSAYMYLLLSCHQLI